jgi:hypothetical protein
MSTSVESTVVLELLSHPLDDTAMQLQAIRAISNGLAPSGDNYFEFGCGLARTDGVLKHIVTLAQIQPTANELQREAISALARLLFVSARAVAQPPALYEFAVPVLVSLLRSSANNDADAERVAWAIKGIAKSHTGRDVLLRSAATALPALIDSCLNDDNVGDTTMHHRASLLEMFCNESDTVGRALPAMARVMERAVDVKTLTNMCNAVSFYLHDSTDECIDAAIGSGVLRPVVKLLAHPVEAVHSLALRCVGHIVAGNHAQAQAVIDLQALEPLAKLVDAPSARTCQEACWALSNITAGTTSQLQAVIDTGVLPKVATLLQSPSNIAREALWVFANGTGVGDASQTNYLANFSGVVVALLDVFCLPDDIAAEAVVGVGHLVEQLDASTARFLRREAMSAVLRCVDRQSGGGCSAGAGAGAADADKVAKVLERAVFALERHRLLELCMALQTLELPALVTVTILDQTSDAAEIIALHRKWAVAVKVKHFHQQK